MLRNLTRLKTMDRVLAQEIREALVDSLYASNTSFIMGAVSGSVIAGVVAWRAHDPVITLCSLALIAVILMRIGIVAAYGQRGEGKRERPAFWEHWFEIGAWSYAALLGLLAFVTLVRSQNPVLHLVVVTTAVGYAAGICGRNAGRPIIAMLQLGLSSFPVCLGLLCGDGLLYRGLGVVTFLFMIAMIDVTLKTHDVVMRALTARQEKQELADSFAEMARHDELTGLINRSTFHERLQEALSGVRLGGPGFAIHWLDLDHFKNINDSLGHATGDELLRVVAGRLTGLMREGDRVARFGGDEFVILSRDTDAAQAERIAGSILEIVSLPIEKDGHKFSVTATVGTALAPQDGMNSDLLLKHADMALYCAKSDGRNTFMSFNPGMNDRLQRRREIEADLRRAFVDGEFEVFYQPVFDVASGTIIGCEALVRWRHPVRGMISPAEFIPVAEDMGFITTLGDWVLREACREAAAWPGGLHVAVNLSAVQLRNSNLPLAILSALSHSGLPASRLELEITETALLADNRETSAALRAIGAYGVRLALDDFGTGYSSLSYLTKYTFHTLKLDGSFVAALAQGEASIAIIHAISGLAQNLGMQTVAEGIETEEQYDQVKRAGYTCMQGFLLGRPMPATEIRARIAADQARVRRSVA